MTHLNKTNTNDATSMKPSMQRLNLLKEALAIYNHWQEDLLTAENDAELDSEFNGVAESLGDFTFTTAAEDVALSMLLACQESLSEPS